MHRPGAPARDCCVLPAALGLPSHSKGPRYSSLVGKRGPSITLKTNFKCSAATIPFRRRISSTTRARHSAWPACAALSFIRLFTSCALKNLLAVGKGDVNPLADRVWIFTLKRQNIGQKSLYARVGHRALPFCPLPSDPLNNTLSGSLRGTVSTCRFPPPCRHKPPRPNWSTLGFDANVGDHDNLPRRHASPPFGVGDPRRTGGVVETLDLVRSSRRGSTPIAKKRWVVPRRGEDRFRMHLSNNAQAAKTGEDPSPKKGGRRAVRWLR